jgi:hypothetical protein
MSEEAAPGASGAEAAGGASQESGERRWRFVLLALAAFVLVPVLPLLPVVLPVEQTIWLLVPALAVCALIGWWAGGRLWVALAWGAFAALVVWRALPLGLGAYASLANGWSLLAAGAFGIVCLLGSSRSFLPRALWAIGLAAGLAGVLSAAGVVRPARAERVLAQQYAERTRAEVAEFDANVRANPATLSWVRGVFDAMPGGEGSAEVDVDGYERVVTTLSAAALTVFPALLALESLAALALAWALWHRLSRARIGAPLGRLREFRFNDQMVWALIVAVVVLLLPSLAPLRGAGLNVLVFFGALYVVRGVAVLVSLVSSAGVVVAGAMIAAAVIFWPAMTAIALGLGLGDTWIDWRGRARGSTGPTL